MSCTYQDFSKLEMICGVVTAAEKGSSSLRTPAYRVTVDFGPKVGVLRTSAQITVNYKLEDLIGKRVVGCVNIGERNICGFQSQFLLLGFPDKKGNIVLITPDNLCSEEVEQGAILC